MKAMTSSSMTNSGIPWMGEVPFHWKRKRLRFLSKGTRDSFIDGDWIETPYITEGGVRLIQCGNVGTGVFEEQGFKYISKDTFRSLNCTAMNPNDVLICRLQSSRTILAGRACLAPDLGVPMITSVDNCILKPSNDNDPRYIVYQLSMPAYLSFIESVARGGTRDRISRSMLGSIQVVSPPLPEQQAIAAFLDRKTAQIDSLIAKKQRMIELLGEKRQALISQAVTKGLDPNVPMKDSGIEWLEEIPLHWEIVAVRWLGRVSNGSTPSRTETAYWSDGVVPWVSSAEVNQGLIDNPTALITEQALADCSLRLLPKGSVLIGMVGQGRTRGMSAILQIDACINQNVAAIELGPRLQTEFLYFCLIHAYRPIRELGRGGQQDALNCDVIGGIHVPLPPSEEQASIVKYLKERLKHIESVSKSISTQISKLQEYRQTLISAAVTGKIDVRKEAAS